MTKKYGELHRVVDFLTACLPSDGKKGVSAELLLPILDFFKNLDEVQREKGMIYSVSAGGQSGNIALLHNGGLLFMLLPRKKGIGILHYYGDERPIDKFLKKKDGTKRVDSDEKGSSKWFIDLASLDIIIEFLRFLPEPTLQDIVVGSGSRSFDAQVCNQAFELSRAGGFECPGYLKEGKQIQEPHKFNPSKDGYEFDHVVPYSKGGPSTAWNIRVLCKSCNRGKSDALPASDWGGAVS